MATFMRCPVCKEGYPYTLRKCEKCGASMKNAPKYNIDTSIKKKPANVNIPKCPTCGSTNVSKISTGERMVSVGMLGIFSKKINKSFKCKDCGYTW